MIFLVQKYFKYLIIHKILVRKPEGGRQLPRSRRRWKDTVTEMGCRDVHWTQFRVNISGVLL
jgi:hypothetical protein